MSAAAAVLTGTIRRVSTRVHAREGRSCRSLSFRLVIICAIVIKASVFPRALLDPGAIVGNADGQRIQFTGNRVF